MWCKGGTKAQEHVLYTKKFLSTIKLLLLGTGETGKTTIIKQMKILHISAFSDTERREKIPFIKQNIHESIYDIINNMDKIDPPVQVESEDTKESIDFILNIGQNIPTHFSEEYFHHVKKAWKDKGVQRTFERSNEYQLIDSAEYFLNHIDRIKSVVYIPTNQDILFCRTMTVSISKIEFDMPIPKSYGGGKAEFWMFDVGGQRGQRKRWIKVFAGIQAILFLIAASDFDLKLREDNKTNRLQESFTIFQEIYSSMFVKDAAMIVFLNKQDLLQKKIEQGKKLEQHFPEYANFHPNGMEQCNTEYDRAKIFMKQKIIGIANTQVFIESKSIIPGKNTIDPLAPRDVYIHYTIATDTGNIKRVFESVHNSILRKALDASGLL